MNKFVSYLLHLPGVGTISPPPILLPPLSFQTPTAASGDHITVSVELLAATYIMPIIRVLQAPGMNAILTIEIDIIIAIS